MGRPSHSRALSIWANGQRVGVWRLPSRGEMELIYDPQWMASASGRPWPWHKARMAMAVAGENRHYLLKDIQRRRSNAMASRCHYGASAEPLIERLISSTPKVVAEVAAALPLGFPSLVADRILEGLQASARRLEAMPPR